MSGNEGAEEDLRVAYLGPAASFGHQAAIEAFPFLSKSNFTPLPSFDALLAAIQAPNLLRNDVAENDLHLDYALLPVENSTNGGVVPVLDLLVRCGRDSQDCLYPDIEIVAEHYLKIHHCLFTPKRVLEEVKGAQNITNGESLEVTPHLKDLGIKILYSHPQVWGQCDKFLSTQFPTAAADRINVSSTSAAATFLKQDSASKQTEGTGADSKPSIPSSTATATAPSATTTTTIQVPMSTKAGNKGAICSYLAGSQNDLACVARNIEDEPGKNTTRFFIIRNRTRSHTSRHESFIHQLTRQQPSSSPLPSAAAAIQSPQSQSQSISYKSLITFTISHSKPGTLADALDIFRTHDLNLTSINTRPSRQSPWHYVFFVECEEERARDGAEDDAHIWHMFKELQRVTERATFLGSWVNRLRHPL